MILGGDFIDISGQSDWCRPEGQGPICGRALADWLQGLGLSDAWLVWHPQDPGFAHVLAAHGSLSCFDYEFMVTEELLQRSRVPYA
ncbi:hypothetical protein NDU88_004214 [Pleurodeles waltl]|uniref:Uncharacterized protein n=1 Tax=Pleurodeles waltl TaxID=8319 RepID=A0AAV7RHH7_PLEWA|nr:hypothetical protein NDU88_004214 [Pleurodeles waltl]